MTNEQIVEAAKSAEKKTEFGELVHSKVSRGVNSAYGIGFLEGAEWARGQLKPSRFHPGDWVVYDGPLGHAILQIEDVIDGRYTFVDNDSTLLVEDSNEFLRPLTQKDVEKKEEWKPQPESLEALMYAIEGKWDAISPTSYLSRRLEDLYEGLVNTYNVDETLLAELPKAASRAYTAEDIEGLRGLKRKIEASMEQKPVEPSDDELQRHQDELYDFKVFAAKQAREHHISFVHDFEWNNFCAELLSYFNEKQKPAEWSEEDKKMLLSIINAFRNGTVSTIGQEHWLKSLPERFKNPACRFYKEDEK